MHLLSRYLFKEFAQFFLTILAGILIVYLCAEFLQKADDFIRAKAAIIQVAKYLVYSMPAIVGPSLPIAALIAALLSLGNLSRHSEIIAMRASGWSLGRIAAPVLLGGALISVFGFVNSELIVPLYSAKAAHIQRVQVEKKPPLVIFRQRYMWLRGPENSIANIDFISPERDKMVGLAIYKLNPDFTLRERITAGSLVWENGAWRLKDSRKYTVSAAESVAVRSADGEIYNVVDAPKDLGMIMKSSEEMNFAELWEYIRKLKAGGYFFTRYEVDLYGKLAVPLASLLMAMIAAPLAVQKVRSGAASRAIAIAVFIAFVYWSLMSVGTALGRSGVLPPILAAWLPNVLFAAAAMVAFVRMHREVSV